MTMKSFKAGDNKDSVRTLPVTKPLASFLHSV
jgi:hypothetical protein